jgi:hypothetical protein
LNATANTLVAPDKPALANLATSNTSTAVGSSGDTAHSNSNNTANGGASKSKHLYSRFVDQPDRHPESPSSSDSIQGRQQRYHHQQQNHHQSQYHKQQQQQQQQHQHQQQHTMTHSMNDIAFSNLAIVSDTVDKEYQTIQAYRDPMAASLSRCMQQKQQRQEQRKLTQRPTSTQLHLHRLAQMGAQQRTFSSSILPTMASLTPPPSPPSPPTSSANEPRPLARQRHQRLLQANNISATTSTLASSSDTKQIASRWSAGAFLDRMLYGVS